MLQGKLRNIKIVLIFFNIFLMLTHISAQNDFGSEKEMKKKADSFFDKDDFVNALPLYSQLLSIYPKDPDYNFRYGVCNLIAGNEKEKSIVYLNLAAKNDEIDKEVFYYLGRALHLNYRFDEAIANYTIFKSKASAKSLTKLDVNRQIEMCNNGKDLLRSITDLQVVDKNEFPITEYFRAYDLTSIETKIISKPEPLLTSVDKKKNDQSVVIQKNRVTEIYFSSYGNDPKNSRDIYKSILKPDFTYTEPVKLPTEINTAYDEEFPYLTPDAKTFYFSSKGHNSMGGYDVFKCDYDAATGKFSAPVNLDYAINTPDDDIMYVYDGKSDFAYFSSKRNSGAGKIAVYKIKNERIPGTIALIKGNFFTTDPKTHQAAKITLKNQAGTKVVGAYTVNPRTGDYQFMVRQGETYSFTVETDGYETMTENVKVPILKELVPVKQTINVKHEGGSDLLTIATTIETGTTPELLQATMSMLRDHANLSVSVDNDAPPENTQPEPIADTKIKKTTNAEIATDTKTEANGTNANNEIDNKLNAELAALDTKQEQLKADLTKTNDLNVKKLINKQIIELEKQKTEKKNQLIAAKNGTDAKSENKELVKAFDDKVYPESAKQPLNRGNILIAESEQLKKEAQLIKNNATTIANETNKNNELVKASKIDKEARQKEIDGYTSLMQANSALKYKQELVIASNKIVGSVKNELSLVENAKIEALNEPNEKLKAEKLKKAYEREVALLEKQQIAIDKVVPAETPVAAADVSKNATDNKVSVSTDADTKTTSATNQTAVKEPKLDENKVAVETGIKKNRKCYNY